jgi:molybdate transport system ATP-binding protein
MTVEVDVHHRLGAFTLEACFKTDGRLTALFGRSGAGKTSLINMIGGLLRPDRGRVVIDGRVLVDTTHRVFIPRHRRRIGYVFQEPRLFPHLTVRQNLLYGRWFTPIAERRESFDHVIDLLGIGGLLDRGPALLSGGEKQRVAIGRALLTSPNLLLMDEPLASLDEARKAEILPYIERLRDEARVPIVYVSHSVPEVARLATTIVLLSEGKVAAAGAVSDIMGRIDLFSLTGREEAGAVLEMRATAHDDIYGLTTLRSAVGELRVPRIDIGIGAHLRLRIRARDVIVALKRPEELSALNVLPGIIAEVGALDGPVVDLRIDLNGESLLARVTRLTVDRLDLAPGRPVFAIIKTVAIDRRSLGKVRPMSGDADMDEMTL